MEEWSAKHSNRQRLDKLSAMWTTMVDSLTNYLPGQAKQGKTNKSLNGPKDVENCSKVKFADHHLNTIRHRRMKNQRRNQQNERNSSSSSSRVNHPTFWWWLTLWDRDWIHLSSISIYSSRPPTLFNSNGAERAPKTTKKRWTKLDHTKQIFTDSQWTTR